jgi:hypothetical protein
MRNKTKIANHLNLTMLLGQDLLNDLGLLNEVDDPHWAATLGA